jgi:hypothetical protein
MARLGTKPPVLSIVSDDVSRLLDRVSKAALIDLYVQALAVQCEGGCDAAPSVEEVIDDANATLRVRGDRLLQVRP